jgi:long-chain fatty acid transport protein
VNLPVRRRSRRSVPAALPTAWSCAAALFGALALGAPEASASPLFDLAGGVGGQGGFNGRVIPGGASSAYDNPALLVDAEAGVTLGVYVLSQQIGISVAPRPGPQFDVPAGIENATHADGTRWSNYPIATSLLQNGRAASAQNTALPARPRQGDGDGNQTFAYQMIGLVTKLFHDQLTIGAYALVPYTQFTGADAFYSDEREQYFSNSLHPELYGDRLVATSVAVGLGVKVTDALSVGAAFTLNLTTTADTPTYVVDAGRLQDILVDSDVKVIANIAPHFGVSYKPTSRFRVAATAHSPEQLDIDTNFTFLLANGVQQTAGVRFTHDYVPWRFGVAASYEVLRGSRDTLTFAASAVYGLWSNYIDRHSEVPITQYAWANTVTPIVGAREQHDAIGSFLDLEYQPTPVPLQTGRTNYVDNDRVGADAGVDYTFAFLGTHFKIGAQLQLQRLIPREQTKLPTPTSPDGVNQNPALVADEVPDDSVLDGKPLAGSQGLQTNNPGWPGFGSQGWIMGGGIALSITP